MPIDYTARPAGDAPRPSRFTRLLYALALALGAVALGVRVIQGACTAHIDWLAMTAPAGVLLGLTGIMVGQRRPLIYYPVLAVSFALIVASYAIPRHRRPPPPGDTVTPTRAPRSAPASLPTARP